MTINYRRVVLSVHLPEIVLHPGLVFLKFWMFWAITMKADKHLNHLGNLNVEKKLIREKFINQNRNIFCFLMNCIMLKQVLWSLTICILFLSKIIFQSWCLTKIKVGSASASHAFFWYDNNKDLKTCLSVTCSYVFLSMHEMYPLQKWPKRFQICFHFYAFSYI